MDAELCMIVITARLATSAIWSQPILTGLMHAGGQPSQSAFPNMLPACSLSPVELKTKYSLPQSDLDKEPVKTQLASYVDWLTGGPNTDRGSAASAAHRTVENLTKVVHQYLGFRKFFEHVENLSLWDTLNGHSIAAYLSFHKTKGNTIGTITAQIAGFRKLLKYLESKTVNQMTHQHIHKQVRWLSNMNSQLQHAMPRVEPEINLPPAHEVIRHIENLRLNAMQALPAQGQPWSLEAARLFHDGALACLMFGYLPPVRLLCLRTLQHPDVAGCLHKGCTLQNCQGNKIIRLETGELQLQLSHYKVEKK